MTTITEEETSSFSMSDYYKVLEYISEASIDRQEPVIFKNPFFVEGDSIVFNTIYPEFNGSDKVDVFVNCHNVDVDVSDICLEFSQLINGNASVLSLNVDNTNISQNSEDILSFTIDEDYIATDNSRKLTGIKSIKLDFGKDVTGVEVFNLVIKTNDYTYTVSDINTACINGEAHVLRCLNDMANEKKGYKEIPSLLKQYVYMAAGAYAWLIRWENEAKAMKEPKSESNNYADRLFGQVESAIERYLSNIENNRNEEYIRMDLFQKAYINW